MQGSTPIHCTMTMLESMGCESFHHYDLNEAKRLEPSIDSGQAHGTTGTGRSILSLRGKFADESEVLRAKNTISWDENAEIAAT
jgi:hypothetical protein